MQGCSRRRNTISTAAIICSGYPHRTRCWVISAGKDADEDVHAALAYVLAG